MSLLHSFSALCLVGILTPQSLAGGRTPVKVSVFYESQCPDSRDFVVQQLLPAVLRAPELIQPVLVPYGKATTTFKRGSYEFSCQHGDSECLGNKLHACAIALTNMATLQVAFAACMLSKYSDVEGIVTECCSELGLPWSTIWSCANGQTGEKLLRAYGAITGDLDPPLSFVPTVLLNGEQLNQTAILGDLWGMVSEISASSDAGSLMTPVYLQASLCLLSAVTAWKNAA